MLPTSKATITQDEEVKYASSDFLIKGKENAADKRSTLQDCDAMLIEGFRLRLGHRNGRVSIARNRT
jgi:hypothetical protein